MTTSQRHQAERQFESQEVLEKVIEVKNKLEKECHGDFFSMLGVLTRTTNISSQKVQ